MNRLDDAPTPLEDELAGRLAAWDDALAQGDAPDGRDSITAPLELQAPLARGLDMLRRLNGIRRGTPTEFGGSTGENPVQIGQRFGRFFVRRLLGRGGFASVFLAYDPVLGREVALKVPHPEALVTPELRERFRIEAQSAAGLEHPNLVAVFEAGEIGPICYLVTAYCPGGSLAQWLRENAAPAPITLAAQWMQQLAEAVQHAHDRGILHRDLKPGNILLAFDSNAGSAPESLVKVADFGLAKPLDTDSNLTRTGAVVGTPNYMAPEQTTGRSAATAATDVYALGAILYELLVGRAPFNADSPIEVLQLVREQDPIAPRKLRPAIPRDLETICLKCLQKEPGQRYARAADLADDLRRFLAHEPIRARPVSRWYRAIRWARRNPLAASLLAALLLAIVGGFAGVLGQWRRADALARQNANERDTAIRERDRADRNYDRARLVVEQLTKLGGDLAWQPGMDKSRQAVYEEILKYYQSLLDEKSDDPAVKLEAARTWFRVGILRHYLGQSREADDGYSHGVRLLDELLAARPDDLNLLGERASAYLWHGHVLRRRHGTDHPTAMASYENAIALSERLTSEHPSRLDFQQTLSNALMNWGSSRAVKDGAAAEAAFRKAAVVQRRMMAAKPDEINYRSEYAYTLEELGGLRTQQKQYSEAESLLRESLIVRQDVVVQRPKRPENWSVLARTHLRLGRVFRETGRIAKAEAEFREASRHYKKVHDEHPDVPEFRADLAGSNARQAAMLRLLNRPDEAVALYRSAIRERDWITANVPAKDPVDARRGDYYFELAQCLSDLNRPAEAAAAYRAAVKDKPTSAGVLNETAWLLATTEAADVRNGAEAARYARAAVEAAPRNANYWNTLAAAYLADGDAHAALAAIDHAESLRRTGSADDWALAALIHLNLDNRELALDYHQRLNNWIASHPNAGAVIRRQHMQATEALAR